MSPRRKEKTRAETLQQRAWSLVKNHVRQMSLMWPYAAESDKRFRVARGEYECASPPGECLGGLPDRRLRGPRWIFRRDHIIPIVDPSCGRGTFGEYFDRALPLDSGFQLLCRPCHVEKTRLENEKRKETRRLVKAALKAQAGVLGRIMDGAARAPWWKQGEEE